MARVGYDVLYEAKVYPLLEKIAHYRSTGATVDQIAAMCEVSQTAFYKMMKNIPELREIMDHSKEALIMNLEQSLFHKALSGNLGAIIFSLKNLAPDRWRDVQQFESKTDVKVVNDLPVVNGKPKKISNEEKQLLAQAMEATVLEDIAMKEKVMAKKSAGEMEQ